ncbi:hypothetical protein NDU88_005274 [Pleurodeles waltl]|uniref:Uncharacterized protein n=1 Tax=Pleurodeles waltl TaxID=8319 RepID=A0AAV7MXD6_PLEWA|nr:hypothetical protein NDU88_005274 [Pleurodeles waltl]
MELGARHTLPEMAEPLKPVPRCKRLARAKGVRHVIRIIRGARQEMELGARHALPETAEPLKSVPRCKRLRGSKDPARSPHED